MNAEMSGRSKKGDRNQKAKITAEKLTRKNWTELGDPRELEAWQRLK